MDYRNRGAHTGGAVNKKMKKFPRIIDYLETHHPAVFKVVDELAMHGSLTPKRGGSITFLLPDAAYTKQIQAAVESDNPEVATDMLGSLILHDLFTSVEDFAAKQDDIPTLLGKRLVVKGVTPAKVTVDDGELTIDKDFKPLERQGKTKRGNTAVWLLKGKVSFEKAPEATYKYLKGAKKGPGGEGVKGAGEDSGAKIAALKKQIIADEIQSVADEKPGMPRVSAAFRAVTRVLRVFEANPQYYECYRKARALLTQSPLIDFYYLFCNPHVFAPDCVMAAYSQGVDDDRNVDTMRRIMSDFAHPALAAERETAVFNNTKLMQLREAKDKLRENLNIDRLVGKKIVKIYDDMDKSNSLAGISPVYPQDLAAIFARQQGLHLLLDQFAWHLFKIVLDVRAGIDNNDRASRLRNGLGLLWEMYPRGLGDASAVMIDKPERYGGNLDPRAIYDFVVDFWRTFGLHTPANVNLQTEGVIVGGEEHEDPSNGEVVDVDGFIRDEQEELDNSDVKITPEIIAALKAYMRAHNGKLPAGLEEAK